jgi:hypothetical protein
MKFMYAVLATIMLASTSGCKADEGFDDIMYDVKAIDGWPLIAFTYSPNIPSPSAKYQTYGWARNSGYNNRDSGSPTRNIKADQQDPMKIKFQLTWYEIATKNAYSAEVSIDRRQLKPDPIQSEFGVIIFRIAGNGDLQAVTYDEKYPPQHPRSAPIILEQACGEKINITDSNQLSELERLLSDPLIAEGMSYHANSEDIPSRCE